MIIKTMREAEILINCKNERGATMKEEKEYQLESTKNGKYEFKKIKNREKQYEIRWFITRISYSNR